MQNAHLVVLFLATFPAVLSAHSLSSAASLSVSADTVSGQSVTTDTLTTHRKEKSKTHKDASSAMSGKAHNQLGTANVV